MKDVIEDGHLLDLISKVEKLERLSSALPYRTSMVPELSSKYRKLEDSIEDAKIKVEDRWLQLENMDW